MLFFGARMQPHSGNAGAPQHGPVFFSGIQARFVFVLLMTSALPIGAFALYTAHHLDHKRDATIERTKQQARSIASSGGALLNETRALLRWLANLPQIRNMDRDPQACATVLAWPLGMPERYTSIGAADLEGRIVCDGLGQEEQDASQVTIQALIQRVVTRRDLAVGSHAVDSRSGQRYLQVAYPIFDEHLRMVGAVTAGLRLSWLRARLASLNLHDGVVVKLVDADGAILIRHPQAAELQFSGLHSTGLARMISDTSGGGAAQLSDGLRATAIEDFAGQSDLRIAVAVEPSYLSQSEWMLAGVPADTAFVLLFSVLAAILGGYWIVLRPVRTLETVVNDYAQGNHAVRVTLVEKDELGHLAETFNAMADKVNQKESALREANAQKSRYLAIASHDLRQPLQVMMVGLETAANSAQGNIRLSLLGAQRAAERLHHQLDVLAGVVRTDASGADIQLQVGPASISKLFMRVDEANREVAGAKGLGLRIVESRLVAESNPEALFTIVNNFVMNAITYTERGRVVIGCRRLGAKCRIQVLDSGPGIPPESRERIFQAFHRLDPGTGKGLGLGLTIARDTAMLLGHSICIHSMPGRGSCFSIELPIWRGGSDEQNSSYR